MPSPQRTHTCPALAENSDQQASQIGAEDSCGRGEPHRAQGAGRRAQLRTSRGLRSTRATARHRVISDGGTSIVSEPWSLRKTHLSLRQLKGGMLPHPYLYSISFCIARQWIALWEPRIIQLGTWTTAMWSLHHTTLLEAAAEAKSLSLCIGEWERLNRFCLKPGQTLKTKFPAPRV